MFSPGSAGRVFGPALTVQMVEMSDTSAPELETHFVDHLQEGHVMYIHQPKGLPSACWGGLMSTRAKWLGAEAVVINGRMRDVNEHVEFGFPVWHISPHFFLPAGGREIPRTRRSAYTFLPPPRYSPVASQH